MHAIGGQLHTGQEGRGEVEAHYLFSDCSCSVLQVEGKNSDVKFSGEIHKQIFFYLNEVVIQLLEENQFNLPPHHRTPALVLVMCT